MAFIATLLYLSLALLSPWVAFPELADLRIMVWLMLIIGVVSIVQIAAGRVTLWIPQIPLLAVFLILTMLSIAVTGWMGGALQVFLQLMVPLAAYFAVMSSTDTDSRIRWLIRILVLVVTYLSIRAILAVEFGIDLQTYAIAEKVATEQEDVLATLYRACGVNFLADPNDFAQLLVACLPLAAVLWRRRSLLSNTVQVLIPSAFMLSALYLTRSRGGLIGLACLAVLAAARLSKFAAPLIGAGILIGTLALGFSGGRQVSLSGGTGADRIELWSGALMVARAHPLLGVGYGNILDHLELTAHNSYLLCMAEIGVPGLFFWLAAFTFTLFQLRLLIADAFIADDMRRYCRLAAASLLSAMVTSFFLSRTYSLTLYLLLGLAVAVVLTARKTLASPPPLFQIKWLAWNGAVMFALVVTIYALVRLRRFSG